VAEYYKGNEGWLKWILVYVLIGGIVYFLVYQFYLKGRRSYSNSTPEPGTSAPSAAPSSNPYSY
jgi:hypothetical protein